jgi:hypothetical protein
MPGRGVSRRSMPIERCGRMNYIKKIRILRFPYYCPAGVDDAQTAFAECVNMLMKCRFCSAFVGVDF